MIGRQTVVRALLHVQAKQSILNGCLNPSGEVEGARERLLAAEASRKEGWRKAGRKEGTVDGCEVVWV